MITDWNRFGRDIIAAGAMALAENMQKLGYLKHAQQQTIQAMERLHWMEQASIEHPDEIGGRADNIVYRLREAADMVESFAAPFCDRERDTDFCRFRKVIDALHDRHGVERLEWSPAFDLYAEYRKF